MKINNCLLVFILGCNVTAEMIHQAVKEKEQLTLSCPHPVEGKVTWSRESTNETKVKLITIDGNGETRHNDPGRRYGSVADKFKSLHLSKVLLSDSGRYFCNNEPVELTVIPSGTKVMNTTRTTVLLECPHGVTGDHTPTWVRQTGTKNVTVFSQNKTNELRHSAENQTLTLREVRPSDTGLYHCDGRAAVYLNVTQYETPEGADLKYLVWVLGLVVPLIFIIFIILFLTWRCRFKTQGCGEQTDYIDYVEIQERFT